jgi:hypothetical protein
MSATRVTPETMTVGVGRDLHRISTLPRRMSEIGGVLNSLSGNTRDRPGTCISGTI